MNMVRKGQIQLLNLRRRLRFSLNNRKSIRKRMQNKQRFWVRRAFSENEQNGEYLLLVKEMILYDSEYFSQCIRITPPTYEQLLLPIAPLIMKESNKMRESISRSKRIAITLQYYVTGDAQSTIAAQNKSLESF